MLAFANPTPPRQWALLQFPFQQGSVVIGQGNTLFFFRQGVGRAGREIAVQRISDIQRGRLGGKRQPDCGAGHSVKAARTTTPCEVAN